MIHTENTFQRWQKSLLKPAGILKVCVLVVQERGELRCFFQTVFGRIFGVFDVGWGLQSHIESLLLSAGVCQSGFIQVLEAGVVDHGGVNRSSVACKQCPAFLDSESISMNEQHYHQRESFFFGGSR